MVVAASDLDGDMAISDIAFVKAPMSDNSALLYGFTMSLGEAGEKELNNNFGMNLADDSVLQIVYSGSRVTVSDDGNGRINFHLDTPYEYKGGNLLIDFSYANIQGSMYVWHNASENAHFLIGGNAVSVSGNPSPMVPVVVITGE